MTDTTILDQFRAEYLLYNQIGEQRIREQRVVLVKLHTETNGGLLALTGPDLQAAAGAWLESGLAPSTVKLRLNMVMSFVSWAYATQRIDADQYTRLKAVKPPRGAAEQLPNPYTKEEVREFWAELNRLWPLLPAKGRGSKAIKRWVEGKGPWGRVYRHATRLQLTAQVRLALDLGLRRAEIFNLNVNDLHFDNEYIVVRGKADPRKGTPRIRSVPFTAEARKAVQTWLEFRMLLRPEHEQTWLTLWGQWVGEPMKFDKFELQLQRAVGQKWRWHRLRHTAASEWLRAGVSLEIVSRLLGHSNITQTLGYAQIVKGDVARELSKYEETFARAVREVA